MAPFERPLLQTRLLVPHLHCRTLPRSSLAALLAAPERHLVLLSAPAGFGKSTLLASWCQRLAAENVAIAWLTLEAGDNDPRRFLTYLWAALAPATGLPSEVTLSLEDEGDAPERAVLTRLLNALAGAARALVLVLDDYHVIRAPAVHVAVNFLLEHLPPQARVAIGSRADPPLPLARLRAKGRLTELRTAELRFTRAELAAFFAAADLAPTAEELAGIYNYTEGWPAGAQLVALTWRETLACPERCASRGCTMPALLACSQPLVFAYLAEDVFANQPAHRKAFLLQTSILELLHGPLCDAVLGVTDGSPTGSSFSRLVLDELDHANLFLTPVDGERRWFRTHQLFRAFLREQLAHEPRERIAALHLRASDWYAARGQLAPAMEHALAAGDPALAARLSAEAGGSPCAADCVEPPATGLVECTGQALHPRVLELMNFQEPLSEREREVLRLVAGGASNQAIAETLVVSLGTVKSHLNHILGKLGARSRTEAVAHARARGLLV